MWKDKLEEIRKIELKFDGNINNGASNEEVARLNKAIKEKINLELPKEFIDVLSIINGIEFNGYILYGIDQELLVNDSIQNINGIIEMNETWYENSDLKKYIFLGDSDMSWFVDDMDSHIYRELDKPSGSEYKEYNSLVDMVDKLFSNALL